MTNMWILPKKEICLGNFLLLHLKIVPIGAILHVTVMPSSFKIAKCENGCELFSLNVFNLIKGCICIYDLSVLAYLHKARLLKV